MLVKYEVIPKTSWILQSILNNKLTCMSGMLHCKLTHGFVPCSYMTTKIFEHRMAIASIFFHAF